MRVRHCYRYWLWLLFGAPKTQKLLHMKSRILRRLEVDALELCIVDCAEERRSVFIRWGEEGFVSGRCS